MTTTYTPDDLAYLDEGDLRVELGRVFDLHRGCRLCFNLCPSFPTMFSFIDARDGDFATMTAAGQDHVVDESYQCKLANGAIERETGTRPVHPIQLMAPAYGIPQEPS